MGAAENKELMRLAFEALAQGDGSLWMGSMSDDVRFTVIGSTRFSRTFEGKKAVIEELMTPLRARLAGRLKVEALRIIADDEHVVVEGRGHATTKDGAAYDNSYCWIHRIVGGKVVDVIEYPDTDLVARTFDPA